MQIISNDPALSSNTAFKQHTFTMEANATAYQLIFKNIYPDPIAASIREIGCNCVDAYGSTATERPWDFHAPTALEPWCSWRDYATGISPRNLKTLYRTLFKSTKNSDNGLIGGLGIGRMSPLAYTQSFEVTSFYKGWKVSCVVTTSEGVPTIIPVSIQRSSEPSGLFVSFSVLPADIERFRQAATLVYAFFDFQPSTALPITKATPTFSGSNWAFYSSNSSRPTVLSGGVVYRIDRHAFPNKTQFQMSCFNNGICCHLPIGSFSFDPGRENVVLDERSIAAIRSVLQTCETELPAKLVDELDNLPLFERIELLAQRYASSPISLDLTSLVQSTDTQLPKLSFHVHPKPHASVALPMEYPAVRGFHGRTRCERFDLYRMLYIVDIPNLNRAALSNVLPKDAYYVQCPSSQSKSAIAAWNPSHWLTRFRTLFGESPNVKLLSEDFPDAAPTPQTSSPRKVLTTFTYSKYTRGTSYSFDASNTTEPFIAIQTLNGSYHDVKELEHLKYYLSQLTAETVIFVPKSYYSKALKYPNISSLADWYAKHRDLTFRYIQRQVKDQFYTFGITDQLTVPSLVKADYDEVKGLDAYVLSDYEVNQLSNTLKLEDATPKLRVPQDRYPIYFSAAKDIHRNSPQIASGEYHAAMEQFYNVKAYS